jgi:hypothetical protein
MPSLVPVLVQVPSTTRTSVERVLGNPGSHYSDHLYLMAIYKEYDVNETHYHKTNSQPCTIRNRVKTVRNRCVLFLLLYDALINFSKYNENATSKESTTRTSRFFS